MYSNEDDGMVRCPYNSTHIVKSFRLPYHILRCRGKYPNIKLENCRYNYSHLVRSEDMLAHLEACPNKFKIESARYRPNPHESSSCKNIYSEDSAKVCSDEQPTSCQREPVRKGKEETGKSEGGDTNENGGLKNVIRKQTNYKEWYRNLLTNSFEEEYKLKSLPQPKTASKAFLIKNSSS